MSSNNEPRFTRRSFLASAGLAAVGTALARTASAAGPVQGAGPAPAEEATPLDCVNILQGSDSTREFSRGNTLPIAALPFGMSHWTLQSQPGGGWFFRPGDRRIQGFRCTHQLSPWLSDYGYATFLPISGNPDLEPPRRASSYRPEAARLRPSEIRLFLERYRAKAQLVPTERCAVISTTYDTTDQPGFLVELPGEAGVFAPGQDSKSLTAQALFSASGKHNAFSTHYLLRFSRPWTSFTQRIVGGNRIGVAHFEPSATPLEVRIGTSFISFEQASHTLDLETAGRSIDQLRQSAETTWADHLSRLEIEGASPEERRTFYSCMYRALLFPRQWHEVDAKGNTVHQSTYGEGVLPGVMYADHGYWDVYRVWYPWMSVVFPERLGQILQAWVNCYREGGWLPQFPAPGYRSCMTGSLIDAVFADAACKKIQGFDLAAAYQGLRKHATQAGNPKAGYGRRGIEDYLALGYVPADRVGQSVAETTDAAYGDFCIAQVAAALGLEEDRAMFMKRSENWRHCFDPKTGFLRGKNADGTWVEPFDPITWGGPYVEGSAWQHRWDVPHNPEGLFEAMGGRDKAAQALEEMLTMPPAFRVGGYGQEIHEMSEMAAVPFGQYAHSNQPVHHVLYLFAAAGRPDRTRFWVDRVMRTLYTPDTFPGDEDTGSMAAWYLMSACGFMTACPGKPDYTLGVPLFPKVTLRRPGQTALVIVSEGRGEVTGIRLNGKDHRETTISHEAVASGGVLEFVRSQS